MEQSDPSDASDIRSTALAISANPLAPITVAIAEPASATTWTAGTTRTIKWTLNPSNTPEVAYFIPEFSVDGSGFSSLPRVGSSTRSANWALPDSARSSHAKARVSAYNSSGQLLSAATSDGFNIVAPGVTHPIARSDVSDANPKWGQTVSFRGDQSRDSSGGQNLKYAWDFGGYGASTQKNPSFAFAGSGGARFIAVQLTITDDQGGKTDSTTLALNVGSTTTLGTDNKSSKSADPVNLATGNYTYEHADLRLPSPGRPFEFKRFYNSKGAIRAGASLGPRWSHTFELRIEEDAAGNASVVRADGNTEAYIKQPAGSYQPEAGVYGALTKLPNGTFLLIDKEQLSHEFDAAGRLTKLADQNGNALSLA